MQVKCGEHRDHLIINGKEDAVWEMSNERPASAIFDFRELKGILQQSREQVVDIRFEPESETWALALVSKRRRAKTSSSASNETSSCRITERYAGGRAALRGLQARGGRSSHRGGVRRAVQR